MELRDLIVTPLVIVLVFVVAYLVRPYVTDEITRKYFLPALSVRIIGALAVGFIYQFYYDGGDTFNFHTHGSRHIWEAFVDDPEKGIKLLLSDGDPVAGTYKYTSRIWFFRDPSSYAIIRLAAFIDLFTFSSYSATGVIFACFSFAGAWMFFLTFYDRFPHLHKLIAIASLFVPSVFFWGSGLFKDTVTLGCLGIATFMIYRIFIRQEFSFIQFILLAICCYGLYVIKIYILLTILPAFILWIFLENLNRINSAMLKALLFPFVMIVILCLGYFAMLKAGEDNPKYSLDAIAKTAQVTAYDIRYWTGRNAGSGYSLGELDGTWQSMVKLAPQAINVSLFRPYLWEVRNPLMLLSAVESLVLLLLTLFVFYQSRGNLIRAMANPAILFCMTFSIAFAFAVGVSTYNFGTLTRYKIPLMPFYLIALILIYNYSNKERKVDVLESTE